MSDSDRNLQADLVTAYVFYVIDVFGSKDDIFEESDEDNNDPIDNQF